ncbi:hypothetical protein Tco_0724329 [Tanacetum coccineum]
MEKFEDEASFKYDTEEDQPNETHGSLASWFSQTIQAREKVSLHESLDVDKAMHWRGWVESAHLKIDDEKIEFT